MNTNLMNTNMTDQSLNNYKSIDFEKSTKNGFDIEENSNKVSTSFHTAYDRVNDKENTNISEG